MVQLEATKTDNDIIISQNSFAHLLNCLDNQKFVHEFPCNGDGLAMGEEAYSNLQQEMQTAIDDFNAQCRRLLHAL